MHARVTRIKMHTDKANDIRRVVEREVASDIQNDRGFRGLYILSEPQSGDSLIFSLWDDREAEQKSREKVSQRLGKLEQFLTEAPGNPTTYEVIATTMPAKAPAV